MITNETIPADVRKLAEDAVEAMPPRIPSKVDVKNAIARAIMQDRATRPTIERVTAPTAQAETDVLQRAVEDERDRLLVKAHLNSDALIHGDWVRTALWLMDEGAMLPDTRACQRQEASDER